MAVSAQTSRRLEIRLPRDGAVVSLVISLLVLAGYAIGYEPAWRPVPNFPATHPITAICLLLLGVAALPPPRSTTRSAAAWRDLTQAAIALVIVLALASISDHILGTRLIARISPFQGVLNAQATLGRSVHFSMNTALALLGIGLAELLLMRRHVRTAQTILFCSAAILTTALAGYIDGLHAFRQSMGPFTLAGGAALITALFAATSGTGFLAVIVGDTEPGRLARVLLLSSTLITLVIGGVLARGLNEASGQMLAYQAVLLLAWTWIVVMASTIRADSIDRRRRRADAELMRDATTDGLTGLLNRYRLDQLLAEPRPDPTRTAMLTIDIDRFRSANNALGTELGDALLTQVAARLSAVAPHYRVARAGGDEFVIFCGSIGLADAQRLAEAVVAAIAVPFRLESREFRITASVGVAHGDAAGGADLRDAADEAMFIAKQQGGNQAVPFVRALHEARMERVGIEQDLHRALHSDTELTLVYQPIISLRDRSVVSLEVLARWTHPSLGRIPPSRFIAIAEDSGLFLELGRKLRRIAVVQAGLWQTSLGSRLPIINLNVSPLELARSDVPGDLMVLIEQHGLRPSGFCLEVTEGSFSDERALEALQDARKRGFRVAMDDFGVGYSSLAQLPRLPLSSVKLDRSFLARATENEDGLSLLATMVQLSHVLKLPVVAEGVETLKELEIVSACGCDSVQGYIFSRPLTALQLEPFLPGNRPWPTEAPAVAAG